MENKLTPELLEKAKQAKTPEELATLAKENGIEMTPESAKAYFDQLYQAGELGDDELDSVAGGRKCGTIYKEGRPVILSLNSCEHYKYNKEKSKKDDGYCQSCTYSTPSGMLMVCDCPQRYNN